MFAVMKHWDIMIGVDRHICWPPPSPVPIGPKPYFVCMLMMGTMVTAEMAFTAVTFNEWTMKRGTDIGPLIPHIGPLSKLTPIDMLFSSSASYFGPSAYCVEGAPAAAALLMVVNPNLNCNNSGPLPTGLVLCFTTHYVGMTIFDVLFGCATMALAVAIEVATSKLSSVAGAAVQKRVIKPLGKRIAAKAASRKAAKAAASAPAKPAPTPGQWQSARPSPSAGSPGGPKIGGHRPLPPKKLSKKKFFLDMGLDVFGELALSAPFTVVNELALEVMAMSGIEEFGAPHEGSSQES